MSPPFQNKKILSINSTIPGFWFIKGASYHCYVDGGDSHINKTNTFQNGWALGETTFVQDQQTKVEAQPGIPNSTKLICPQRLTFSFHPKIELIIPKCQDVCLYVCNKRSSYLYRSGKTLYILVEGSLTPLEK